MTWAKALDWLRRFLKAFIPAAIDAWLAANAKKKVTQAQGAADQRAADRSAEDAIVTEAKERSDEIDRLSDDDAARRFDRLRMRKP